MRRKSRDSRMRLGEQRTLGLVKLYDDGVVQAVTFAYLVY